MPITMKTSGGLQKLADALNQAETSQSVEVGILNKYPHVGEYARWLEYGWVQRVTKKQHYFLQRAIGKEGAAPMEGASLVLPPRPTFRATMAEEAGNWQSELEKAIKVYGVDHLEDALSHVGSIATQDIKATIERNGTRTQKFRDRSSLTMALINARSESKKRRDSTGFEKRPQALKRSGDFYDSIGYDIVKKS